MTIVTAGYHFQPGARIMPDVIVPMGVHELVAATMQRPLQVRLLIAWGANFLMLNMTPTLIEADTFINDGDRSTDEIASAACAILAELPLRIVVVNDRIHVQITHGETSFTCDLNAWWTRLLRQDLGLGV